MSKPQLKSARHDLHARWQVLPAPQHALGSMQPEQQPSLMDRQQCCGSMRQGNSTVSAPDTIVLRQAPVNNVELPEHDAELLHEATSVHTAARRHTEPYKQMGALFCCGFGQAIGSQAAHTQMFSLAWSDEAALLAAVWTAHMAWSSACWVPGLHGRVINRCSVGAATLQGAGAAWNYPALRLQLPAS